MKIRKIAVSLLSVSIVGCAPLADLRLDGQPPMPKDQVVRLGRYTSESFHGRPLNTHWAVDIVAIDGVPIPKQKGSYIQISPGKHSVQYQCLVKFQFNDTGGARGNGTVDFDFQMAGTTYYPYATGTMDGYQQFGSAGIESNGKCWVDRFSTDDPYMHR